MTHFADAAAWEAWLAEHHQTAGDVEVWLEIAKRVARHLGHGDAGDRGRAVLRLDRQPAQVL